jgi:hypothetical protein
MGPGIIIPLVIVAIVVPVAFTWAKKTFKDSGATATADAVAPAVRLTSNALRELPTPEWRVVYEIAEEKLGGVEHVLIGAPGVFAVQTSIETLPSGPDSQADAQAVAGVAIIRGDLDDALGRCAMSSDRLVRVHWGAPADAAPASVDMFPGLTVVDGRRLTEWIDTLPASLSASQVDLAWQAVTTAIGRPDPLA